MQYTKNEVLQFVEEEDVKFIRLAFCDVFGKQKNISIMTGELERAFDKGVAIDASAIRGFGDETRSDLFLHPDPSTLAILPWRPEHGRVVRMFCFITYPDGRPFECDGRYLLKCAEEKAKSEGLSFEFGPEMEFYLFKTDDLGVATKEPYDNAGYMDVAPEDKGENVRREICLTLEQMGISPESSHHEEGPGQNEIDFKYSSALSAADNAVTFRSVVKTVSNRNGVYADFSPKPIKGCPGNGFHINFSIKSRNDITAFNGSIAGLLAHIKEMTLFLNPSENSYSRLGENKAPIYIAWSEENRSPLIRIPASPDKIRRIELRSPDTFANPYIAFTLIICAAIDGIKNGLELPEQANLNFFSANEDEISRFEKLPSSIKEAKDIAKASGFIGRSIPKALLEYYIDNAK